MHYFVRFLLHRAVARGDSLIRRIAAIIPDREILIRFPEQDIIGLKAIDLVRRLVNHDVIAGLHTVVNQAEHGTIHGIAAEILRPTPEIGWWIERTTIDFAIADKFPKDAILDVLLLGLAFERPIQPAGPGPVAIGFVSV